MRDAVRCATGRRRFGRMSGYGAEAVWANTRAAIPALREINLRARSVKFRRIENASMQNARGSTSTSPNCLKPLRRYGLVHQTSRNKGVEDANPRNIGRFPTDFTIALATASRPTPPATPRRLPSCWQWCHRVAGGGVSNSRKLVRPAFYCLDSHACVSAGAPTRRDEICFRSASLQKGV